MIKKYICMLGVGGCLFLSGCSNDVATVEGDSVQPILFSASQTGVSVGTETQTRAAIADFPNNKSIAIIGAKSINENAPTNWTSANLHLSHVKATAGAGKEEDIDGKKTVTYPISLETPTYWPFSANEYYLGFVAYSPQSHATLSNNGSTELTVAINGSNTFPDLLYTTPTTSAYNKVSGKDGINLGEFKHAMASLVIKVTPVDATNPDKEITSAINGLKITNLSILTKVTTGKLDINFNTPQWVLTNPAADATKVYTLISTPTDVPYNSENKGEYYLFPATDAVNTVELSQIGFTLKDGNITSVDKAYAISEFKNKDNQSVKLEMGKTTVLNIKVKIATVEEGENPDTKLEGTLIDWIYKGSSSVTIE